MITVEALYPAADRVSRIVKRYGWNADDCRQEAWLVLNRLETQVPAFDRLSDTERVRYAAKALMRHCFRKARIGYYLAEPIGESMVTTDLHESIVRIELADLIESAPGLIKDYLTLRVLEERGWNSTRDALGLSNDRLAQVRHEAADWLLRQYEGQ